MTAITRATLPTSDAVIAALAARRERALATFREAGLENAIVLIASGVAVPVEGTDGHYPFRVHDNHYYLAGSRRDGAVLVLDPQAAEPWTLYAFVADATERVWHGDTDSVDDISAQTGITQVRPVSELETELSRDAGRPLAVLASWDVLESPNAYELHPGVLESFEFDDELSERLEGALHIQRRAKDPVEIGFMRAAAHATVHGHETGMRLSRAGMSEIDLRIEIEAAFQRAGGDGVAYASIVASGVNAAVLHATPGARQLGADELLLVDAGAEVAGYDCDITRTWPIGGRYSADQAALYDAVLAVQTKAVAGARAGVEYRDLHIQACVGIAEGLVGMGVLRGDPEQLVERDAQAIFFPHGIGHQIGLATHDVAGYLDGREPSDRPGLRYLRTDLPLEAGYVVTIEPGIYFIPALLEDPILRMEYADCVDFDRAEALMPLGGVRIEDDVHVTSGDPEVLTGALAKTRDAVEALCTS